MTSWRDRKVSELNIPSSMASYVVRYVHNDKPIKTWGDVWDALEDAHDVGLGMYQERVRAQIEDAMKAESEDSKPKNENPKPDAQQEQPMTTETRKRKKKDAEPSSNGAAHKSKKKITGIPVKFGKVTVGGKSAAVRITISRENLDLHDADETLCGRRLTGRLIASPNKNSNPDQKPLTGMEDADAAVPGSFDVNSLSLHPETIACTLSFALAEVDRETMTLIANKDGRVEVESVTKIDPADDDEQDLDEPEPTGEQADEN